MSGQARGWLTNPMIWKWLSKVNASFKLRNYMRGKGILLSVSFFSPITEDELDRPDGWRKYETWDEVPPLNLSDLPRPNLGEDSLTGAIEKTLPDIGLLALLNVLLFMVAYALFIKKT